MSPEREGMAPPPGLAPGGMLRAAINLGNPVLANRDAGTGALGGVSVALAEELSRRIGCALDLAPFDSAAKVVAARQSGGWDVAFLAVDPGRAAEIAFTEPYVVIEGVYVVRRDAPWTRPEALDRAGVRIAVGDGAAYDLHLRRTLRHAELVRAPSSGEALTLFTERRLDAAAGIRQAAVAFVRLHPELRLIDEPFMQIRQAVAVPSDRPASLAYLDAFIREMKASGFVRNALNAAGQQDVAVAD